jgi:hypothetical protein
MLQAEASFAGTALERPIETTAFISGAWQGLSPSRSSIRKAKFTA